MAQIGRDGFYTITALTREFGVTTRTIRFYEDEGLISPMRRGRTRLFSPSDRRTLATILRGKRLGFSIAEIKELLSMYQDSSEEMAQLNLLIDKIKERREMLEEKRNDILEILRELDQVEEVTLARLAEFGVGR